MDEKKLYVCLEAKHAQGEGQQRKHVYLICSLSFNDLTSTLPDSPTLTTEASFEGYPSMGCGFYQSKIVFAGGQLPQEETDLRYDETDLEHDETNLEYDETDLEYDETDLEDDIVEQSNYDDCQVQLVEETDSVYEDVVDQSNHDGPQVQLVEGTNLEYDETDSDNDDVIEQSNYDGCQVQLVEETDSVYEDVVDQSNHDGPQVQLVEGTNHNGLMIFDLYSKQVSSDTFPSMLRGKLKPLVFQLHDKLYVMDTVSGYHDGSFEYYYPTSGEWNLLRQPCYDTNKYVLGCRRDCNYPCLVFGNAIYLSVSVGNNNFIFLHHPNLTYKSWFPSYVLRPGNPLNFSGTATFCHHDDVSDFLIISFTNRVAKIHLFDLTGRCLPASRDLFTLPSSSESVEDEQVSGYFADFGDCIFSLTASDSVCIYVRTFQIFGPDDPMLFQLLSHYEYRFDALSFGVDIISVVGCFAPYQNHSAIEHSEKALKKRYSKFAQRFEDDPATFKYCGKEIEVPEGTPGSSVQVSVDLPMEPDPVRVFCILPQ